MKNSEIISAGFDYTKIF